VMEDHSREIAKKSSRNSRLDILVDLPPTKRSRNQQNNQLRARIERNLKEISNEERSNRIEGQRKRREREMHERVPVVNEGICKQESTCSYDLQDFSEVPNYAKRKKDQCMDVMGRLHYYKEPQVKTIVGTNGEVRNSILRDIYLINEQEELLRITLWGNLANAIDEAIQLQKKGDKAILLVTSILCANYLGDYYCRSSLGTRILLNQDIEEIHEFTKKMGEVDDTNSGNERTIKQILDMVDGDTTKMDEYWCTATIIHVYNNSDWHYMGCGKCNRKTEYKDGKHTCKYCKSITPSEKPSEVYKLNMDIEDESSMMMIAGFDGAITNLLDISANDMIKITSQIRKYNWETKDTSSMSVMKIEEIPGLKSKIKEILSYNLSNYIS
ncbi:hypothetical protein FRX31_033808, partial [Thalictrum thalictroides]